MDTSKNKLAEQAVGLRCTDGIAFDQPAELGFKCPVCEDYELFPNGNIDQRLHWSEYNGFIWCSSCNKDYPSVLCMPDIDKAIDIYLRTVINAKRL